MRPALFLAAALTLAWPAGAPAVRQAVTRTAPATRRCVSPESHSTLMVARRPGVRTLGVGCRGGRRVAAAYTSECRDELLYEADCSLRMARLSWRCAIRVVGPFGDRSHVACRAAPGRGVVFDVFFRYP